MLYCLQYFDYLFDSFLLTRDSFLNYCPMKLAVVCQPVSKFGMFTCVFSLNGKAKKIFGFLVGEHKRAC